jgi:hypothetical protein
MKYIVGASLGGLFGFSVPLMMDAEQIETNKDLRVEAPQRAEGDSPTAPSETLQHLPDDICRYITYETTDPKEQAKECLKVDIPAIPAI